MLAAVVTGPHRMELREFPEPIATDGDVVVEVSHCGVCGTDLHAFAGGGFQAPGNCGHEWVGRVSAVGSDVVDLRVGDRVVGAVPSPCGSCAPCTSGHEDFCATALMVAACLDPGAPPHGAFAARLAVSAGRVITVPPGLSDEEAAMVEPATVAFRAVRRSGVGPGDRCVVLGAGPIGLLVLQWVRAAGADPVVVVEPDPGRRQLAAGLGADVVAEPGAPAGEATGEISDGLGADVVFECAGRQGTIQSSVELVRRGGTVCLVGVSEQEESIVPAVWMLKEVSLVASLAYGRSDFTATMRMMAAGRIQVAPLHSSTACLAGLPEVFEGLCREGSDQTKVLVRPAGWL